MSKTKTKSKSLIRRSRRTKYLTIVVVVLTASLGFGAVFGRWRNLPVIRSLVATSPRVVPPTSPPTIPSSSNPSKEYIYGGGKLIATESAKSDQTITFNPIADRTYGDAPFSISGTASSGLAVSFTVTSGPATVSGSTVTITGTGPVNITAAQAGNDGFNPAPAVSQAFQVAKATATVNLSGLPATYDGAAHFASATTNPAGLNVALLYSQSGNNIGSPTNAGSYSVNATVNDPNYQGNTGGTFVISKASATVNLTNLAPTYDGAAHCATATTSPANLNVTLTYSQGGNPVGSPTNAGSFSVNASVNDTNYEGVASGALVISKASATVSLTNITPTYDGAAHYASVTTSPASLNVTLVYSQNGSPVGSPTNAGSYTVNASVNEGNYQGNAAGSLVIAKAPQTITFNALSDKVYGDSFTVSASSTSGLSVSFAVSGPATISGSTITINGTGTATVSASQAGNSNFNSAATVDRPFNVAKASATITLGNLAQTYNGTPKAASATTSPSGLTGVSITYPGPTTTAPTNVGNYAIVASLNNANYSASDAAGTLVISAASASITLSNLNQTYSGTPRSATAATNPPGLTVVSITYNNSATAPTNAGSYAVVAHLTNATYSATDATGTLVIAKATPTITWANPADITHGTALGTTQLNASASFGGSAVAGTFACSPAAGTILNSGNNQTLSTTFTPSDGVDFNSANGAAQINVTPGSTVANGYAYQRSITIDHTKVPNSDQSNFPLLISGTYSYLATVGNGGKVQNSNGYDVIFTADSGCATKLNHEIETYNGSTGAVNYWVKVPTISHVVDTIIYLCYGKAGVTTDQSNKTAVWDSNYVGVWHLPNGSSLNTDDSTSNAKNAYPTTGASAIAGKVDGGMHLAYGNEYAYTPNGYNFTDDITYEFWARSSGGFFLFYAQGGLNGYNPLFQVNSGLGTAHVVNVAARTNYGAVNYFTGLTTVDDGVWHHIVAVRDTVHTAVKIYVDGALDTSTTYSDTAAIDTTGNVWLLGRGLWGVGELDEVHVSKTVRPADWIRTEYNNQGSPATFYTISSTTLDPFDGYSVVFDGSAGRVNIPFSSSLNITGPITVEGWFKVNNNNTIQTIASNQSGVGGYLLLTNTGAPQFYYTSSSGSDFAIAWPPFVSAGVWHHMAGVFDGSQIRVYLDGILCVSKYTTLAPGPDTSGLSIGNCPWFPFNGWIDEVRVSTGAVYTSNFTPEKHLTTTANTKGLWKFDGQSLQDSSGNGNHGTFAGGASFSTNVP